MDQIHLTFQLSQKKSSLLSSFNLSTKLLKVKLCLERNFTIAIILFKTLFQWSFSFSINIWVVLSIVWKLFILWRNSYQVDMLLTCFMLVSFSLNLKPTYDQSLKPSFAYLPLPIPLLKTLQQKQNKLSNSLE